MRMVWTALLCGTLRMPQRAATAAIRSGCSSRHSCKGEIPGNGEMPGKGGLTAAAGARPLKLKVPQRSAVHTIRIQ